MTATDPPRSIGPYLVTETIGRGGMGVVYRARHSRTGEIVALKTVRVAQAGLLAGIRREIHALARIHHPGIVRIVSEGVHDGVPWYAMELLKGWTLRHLASSTPTLGGNAQTVRMTSPTVGATGAAPESYDEFSPTVDLDRPSRTPTVPLADVDAPRQDTVPANLIELLTLVRRLCAPLGYLHGEGIVHRDLKPDNVLVRLDGMPVLMDFGLMSASSGGRSRDALDLVNDMAGTVAYMAPEQARGEPTDARADLYALGCILYELVTGRPPFLGGDPVVIVQQHIGQPPLPPTRLVSGVPAVLEELILRLLEKDPHARLAYADDVAAVLASLGAEEGATATTPATRPFLYRPGFRGRDEELDRAVASLAATGAHARRIVAIGGEMGVGKTRFVSELGREAARRGHAVMIGECVASGAPLHAFRRVLQSAADMCREHGPAEAARLFGRRAGVLALYEPALEGLPGLAAQPDPAEIPPNAARLRLFTYLDETLAAIGARQPLTILLDDVHCADDLTVGFLELVARSRRGAGSRYSIVLTYRSEEAPERVAHLVDGPNVDRIPLDRLRAGTVAGIVADMLGHSRAPEPFVRFLSSHAEGVPFLVAEFLRTAVEESLLYRDRTGCWQVQAAGESYEDLRLPRSVRELVARRLDALTSDARALAQVASVLGREMEGTILARVSGMSEEGLMESLAQLIGRHLLEETAPGRLRFLHFSQREVPYASLPDERRIGLHRAAAEAVEALHGAESSEHAAELADHWERAGVPDRATDCSLRAAREAARRHAHAEAARLYDSYLRLAKGPSSERVAARNELAHGTLLSSGRLLEAEAQHAAALDEARALGDRALEGASLRDLAHVRQRLGRPDESQAAYEQALAIDRGLGNPRGEATTLQRLAVLHQYMGRIDEARALYGEVLAIAHEIGDTALEGPVLVNLANINLDGGEVGAAAELYERSLELARADGNRRLEAIVLGNLALFHYKTGQLTRAEALYEESLRIHREMGNRPSECLALANLGICLHNAHRYTEARALYEEALGLSRAMAEPAGEASVLLQLGSLSMDEGDLESACRLGEEALDLHRRLGEPTFVGATLTMLASARRLSGAELGEVERLLHEAEAILEQRGDLAELTKCLCHRGLAALAAGRDAREQLDRARAGAVRLQAGPDSEVGVLVARLERAVDAAQRGLPLAHGEVLDALPQPLRRRLAAEPDSNHEPGTTRSSEAE